MKIFTVMIVLIALGFASGCGSTQPSRFYVLSPIAFRSEKEKSDEPYKGLSVALQPVVVASYLDRPQMILRDGPYEVSLDEFHRWAAPIDQNILQVLVVDLRDRIPGSYIDDYPWPNRVQFDYQVHIEVLRFDGRLGGHVTLAARWTLYRDTPEKLLPVDQAEELYTVTAKGDSYDALVAAMSSAICKLSEDIGTAIKQRDDAGTDKKGAKDET